MGTLETLTPDGSAWPAAFTAPKNGEVYDAADDEACHQATADAATWLKERATRVQDLAVATDGTTYAGPGSDDWQDTAVYTTLLSKVTGDFVTAIINFEVEAAGDDVGQVATFRVKISDTTGASYSRVSEMPAPVAGTQFVTFCLIGQRELEADGTVTITLQVKHNDTGVQATIPGGSILSVVERKKADDV
jgi:hypothetical protein